MRLLPMSNQGKDIEILALRHQLIVLQRQVGKPAFTQTDRMVLAGLLHYLPVGKLRQLLLLVHPDTLLRWHRDLIKRRHPATCAEAGRPRTVRSAARTWQDLSHAELERQSRKSAPAQHHDQLTFSAALGCALGHGRGRLLP